MYSNRRHGVRGDSQGFMTKDEKAPKYIVCAGGLCASTDEAIGGSNTYVCIMDKGKVQRGKNRRV